MDTRSDASLHRCLVYEGDPSEQLPIIVPLLIGGLKENRRCLYLGDPAMVDLVRSGLAEEGLDVGREAGRGALVLTSERGHLRDGAFDPAAMVEMLRRAAGDAVRDGFAGLWATGDMRWQLGEDRNFERLQEYEARLEQVFHDLPLAGVCQYHRDAVPAEALQAALLAHRSVYLGRALQPDNLFYVPPDVLLAEAPSSGPRLAEWMWRQLGRVVRAELQRDEAMRALSELNASLERRVEERTADVEAFAYSLSHDLRAPLRAVDGYCRDILEAPSAGLDERVRRDLPRVLDAAGRMSRLIDGLLELARLSRHDLILETVDLSRLALEAVDELRKAEPARTVAVAIQPGLAAKGDARLLSAALGNLLGNAWKFTGEAPRARIELGALALDGKRVFYVRDNGAGFDMAYSGKLFKSFQRLHPASRFPGSGLGLASVQRVIARHGGRVWAESAPGRGATFYFTLPEPGA